MRWLLVALLTACTTESADVPATIVHVSANRDCGGVECERFGLESMCGYDMPVIEPTTSTVAIYSHYEPSELEGLVQLQYTGSIAWVIDGKPDHMDASLAKGERFDVYAMADFAASDPLYRLDALGAVTDIDSTRLTAAEGSTLHFTYSGITEDHVIDAPRIVSVQTDDAACYCSVGGPSELAGILAIVLIPWRRRRKLRA